MTTVYADPDPDTTTRSDAEGRAPATTPPHADNDATATATTTTALRFIRAIPSSRNRCRPFVAPRDGSVTDVPRFVRRGMHARRGTEVARIPDEFVARLSEAERRALQLDDSARAAHQIDLRGVLAVERQQHQLGRATVDLQRLTAAELDRVTDGRHEP